MTMSYGLHKNSYIEKVERSPPKRFLRYCRLPERPFPSVGVYHSTEVAVCLPWLLHNANPLLAPDACIAFDIMVIVWTMISTSIFGRVFSWSLDAPAQANRAEKTDSKHLQTEWEKSTLVNIVRSITINISPLRCCKKDTQI